MSMHSPDRASEHWNRKHTIDRSLQNFENSIDESLHLDEYDVGCIRDTHYQHQSGVLDIHSSVTFRDLTFSHAVSNIYQALRIRY